MIFLEHRAESGEVFLNQRRVFTVPSKAGWMFVLLLLLLFITATNYNLNLGFMLTFLLAACAMINAFLGFRNLAYLHLSSAVVKPVFAGESVEFPVDLHNRRNYPRYALHIGFSKQQTQSFDLAANSQIRMVLQYPSQQRGYLAIPRIRLQTWFPLGLLYAWSSWWPDRVAIIYPTPETMAPPLPFLAPRAYSRELHLRQ